MENTAMAKLRIIDKNKKRLTASIKSMIDFLRALQLESDNELEYTHIDAEISFWECKLNDLFIMEHDIIDHLNGD